MDSMHVALAHDHLYQIGGAEAVLREMAEVFPTAPLYSLINNSRLNLFRERDVHTSFLQQAPGGINFFKWYLGLMPLAWERFDFANYDVVISSCSGFVKGIITPASTVHVCYCHTPTRYLWSDSNEYVNTLNLPKPLRLYLERLLSDLRAWDQIAAQRVDHFVSNSKFIGQKIRKYYHRESTVIYPPVDTAQFKISQNHGNYYLIVSRLRPYKKVDIAVEAFNNLKLPLVIIGGGEESKRLKKMAKRNITFLGEVTPELRNEYLANCQAFIHPQEEDFGISAVESMASGRPVIAYRAGGATETVEEGATGIFFNEQNWESLAYAVLSYKMKDFNSEWIRHRSLRFDKANFRRELSAYISSVSGLK